MLLIAMSRLVLASLLALVARSASQSVPPTNPSSTIDINRRPPLPQETVCGDIVNDNLQNDSVYFYASDAFQCLTSVPFNAAVATRYIQYLNTTFQFLPSTAYLRNPPPSYQQPPVDLFGALQQIQANVDAGLYNNQYAFEWAVKQTLQQLHDSHVSVYGGILSTMSFFSPFNLVSVSSDGKELPKVYIYEDLIRQVTEDGYTASPVSRVDGIDAVTYLKSFGARQSYGLLEPNADFNSMMYSPAQELFGVNSFSDSAPFYEGAQIELEFANGSSTGPAPWIALYESPGFTGPLATGGDYYNFFVLGLNPANFEEQAEAYYQQRQQSPDVPDEDQDTNTDVKTSWHDSNPAYPEQTIMHEESLGEFSSGSMTGYYLADQSTAVLSIPTFEQSGNGVSSFSQAIKDFVGNATARKASKVIIDLQQNTGGSVALAYYLFNTFFPHDRPFVGSRMRSQHFADVLGDAFTSHFESLNNDPSSDDYDEYLDLFASEWVSRTRINAQTERNFTSWKQFYGPLSFNRDFFSRTQRYDLSSPLFLEQGFGASYSDPCFYNNTCKETQLWSAENIVMLTDGICGSTCSLFVEAMERVGVQSIVVGGIPQQGPMQTASGTRAAVEYSGDEILDDFYGAISFNSSVQALFPQALNDTGMAIVYTGLSLRDQVRRNESIPNQMLFLPAKCRIFWTLANFYNYTRLYIDAHDATFVDNARCVAGSTNVTTAPTPPSAKDAPSTQVTSHDSLAYFIAHPDLPDLVGSSTSLSDVLNDGPYIRFKVCADGATLATCSSITLDCEGRCTDSGCLVPDHRDFKITRRNCYNGRHGACQAGLQCAGKSNIRTTSLKINVAFKGFHQVGECEPQWNDALANTLCSVLNSTKLESIVNSGVRVGFSDA